jgi:hypothetical protein
MSFIVYPMSFFLWPLSVGSYCTSSHHHTF